LGGNFYRANVCSKSLLLGVNFINILCSNFLYKSALRSFSLVKFWLCNFLAQKYWRKNIGAKGSSKMLVKLTTGVGQIYRKHMAHLLSLFRIQLHFLRTYLGSEELFK